MWQQPRSPLYDIKLFNKHCGLIHTTRTRNKRPKRNHNPLKAKIGPRADVHDICPASISPAASSASLSSCIRSASRYAQTLGHHYRPSPICNGSRATKVFLNHIQARSYIAAVLCARLAATHVSVLTHVPVQLAWCSGLSWPPQTLRSPPPASDCAERFSR